jgi:hypothetical protein
MKTILIILCTGFLSPSFAQTTVKTGLGGHGPSGSAAYAIAGVAIKVTCKPASCPEVSGVTDAKGNVEFKGLKSSKYKLLEVMNQRIAGIDEPITFDPITLESTETGAATTRAKLGPIQQEIASKKNGIIITVTYQDDWIKVNVSKSK